MISLDLRSRGWLKSFNVDAHHGRGEVKLSPHRAQAMKFKDVESAYRAYMTIPLANPIRDDGKPNRPLTAFTAEFCPEDKEPIATSL